MDYAAVDLFCGIGGLTNGLQKANVNVLAGIDFEGSCRFAYETNNKSRFIQRDITTVTPDEIRELYPEGTKIRILAGCAPCQPFSKYTQRYRKDGYKDEKWRLLYSFAELAKSVLPEIVAMENVPELAATTVFSDFVRELEQCGYHVDHKVVFCPDYGVPQSRKRLVIIFFLFFHTGSHPRRPKWVAFILQKRKRRKTSFSSSPCKKVFLIAFYDTSHNPLAQ